MRVLRLAPPLDSGSGIAQYASAVDALLEAEGVDVVRVHQPAVGGPAPLNSLADVRAYVSRAVQAAKGCDVVHVELGGGALREFYSIWGLRRTDPPIVVTVHDPPRAVWYPFLFDVFRRKRRLGLAMRLLTQPIALGMDRWALNHVALIGTTTDGGVASLKRSFPRLGDRIVRFEYPCSAAPQVPVKPTRKHEGLDVAFHGHWMPGKGIETLLAAVASMRSSGHSVSLTLYGGTSVAAGEKWTSGYRAVILQQIGALDLSDVVTVEGFVPDEKLLETLRRHDAVVLPYAVVPEGHRKFVVSTSAAAHDAILAGVPVVCSRARAMTELIEHEVNGLVFDGSEGALTQVLEQLVLHPELLQRLSKGAEASASALADSSAGSALVAAYREARNHSKHTDERQVELRDR